MVNKETISKIAAYTNDYAIWKQEQKYELDKYWYEITSNDISAYFGMNILMGINSVPSYKYYWSRDQFLGNDGIKSVMTVKRYEKLTEYFRVNDKGSEPENETENYYKLYRVQSVIDMTRS